MADKNQDNIELIKRYREGDVKAKDLLVKRNIKLVFLVVNKVFPLNSDKYEDAASAGKEGFIKAINAFDLNAGVKFTTYATVCIRNELMQFVRRVNSKNGKLNNSVISLDTFETEDGDVNLYDMIEDNLAENPEMKLVHKSQLETLKKLMPMVLSKSEQLAVNYIIQTNENRQDRIANGIGYSRPSVSRILKGARQKLKNAFDELEKIDNEKAKLRELTGEKNFKDSLEIFRERHAKTSQIVGKTDVKTK